MHLFTLINIDLFLAMDKFVTRGDDKKATASLECRLEQLSLDKSVMRPIRALDLHLSYGVVLSKRLADDLFAHFESEIQYYSGDLSMIKVFGKTMAIPRKQSAYGDEGLDYSFSGTTLPAKSWTPVLEQLRRVISDVANVQFNFVLINRYKDGEDYVGEHRDNEKDLDKTAPIASLSLGAARDFIFRHGSARKRKATTDGAEQKPPDNVKLLLQHGSLLFMHPPTNQSYYHSLPVRKGVTAPRINLTFRVIAKHDRK